MAWHGKILRVNLSAGSCASEDLNMEWAQQYLGQRGLASKYLIEETDPKVDPLSPDNKRIIATGSSLCSIHKVYGFGQYIAQRVIRGSLGFQINGEKGNGYTRCSMEYY